MTVLIRHQHLAASHRSQNTPQMPKKIEPGTQALSAFNRTRPH